MASSHDESSQPSSAMKPEHVTTTYGNMGIPTHIAEVKVPPPSKNFSSVSSCYSSPDSILDDDPFGEDDYEPDKYSSNKNNLPKLDKDNESCLVDSEKPVSGSSTLSSEPSNHEVAPSISQSEATHESPSRSSSSKLSTTESPPTQVMERSANESYRIPASVFATDKSTNPGEWSVASNESLFSIHMGTTASFTKDHVQFELGAPTEISTPTDTGNLSTNEPSASKATDGKSHELGKAEAEPLKVDDDLNRDSSFAEGCNSWISEDSGTSTKSFAFPVLAGDVDKEGSAKAAGSIKISAEQQEPQSEPQTETPGEPQTQTEPEEKTPAATENAGQSSWLSYFPCCSRS